MKIFLPQNLNLAEHLKNYPPQKKIYEPLLALLLGQIISIRSGKRKLIDNYGCVPLSTRILQRLVRNYRDYLDYAIETNIIWENPQFIRNVTCRRFKFQQQYSELIAVYLQPEKFRLPIYAVRNFTRSVELPKNFLFLAEPFKNELLTIDEAGAKDYFKRQYHYYRSNPEEVPTRYDKKLRKWVPKKPVEIYNQAIYFIERLAVQDYSLKIDHSGGRCYTILTSCPKEVRHFLRYDGKLLFTADVSNCQPYEMVKLMRPEFYFFGLKKLKNRFGFKIEKYLEDWLRESVKGGVGAGIDENFNLYSMSSTKYMKEWKSTDVNTLITLVNRLQSHASQEFHNFSEITTTGGYYRYIKDGLISEVDPDMEDKEVKVQSLRILFSSNSYSTQAGSEPKQWFAKHFNTIYEITCLFKRYGKSFFPILLQAMESEIMLNRVARRLYREQPEVPFFTIHDCMMSTVGHEELVTQVMKDEFKKCIGVPPHIKYDHYSPDSKKIIDKPY